MSQSTGSLREVHGRGMNTLNEHYRLPADRKEMDRLSLQHRMWYLLMGGLYPSEIKSKVDEILRPEDGIQKSILDIGCGSGIWPAKMAEAFPHVEVIGLDLAENNYPSPPSNFRFIQGDVTHGLPQFKGKFDLIHARSIIRHLADPAATVNTMAECLKPGGLCLIPDGGVGIFDADKSLLSPLYPGSDSLPNQDTHSWMAGWVNTWMKMLNPKLSDPLIRDNLQFGAVTAWSYFCPVNWAGEGIENGEELGMVMDRNTRDFLLGCKPVFLTSSGFSQEVIEEWLRNINNEFDTRRRYVLWDVTYAFKL